MKLRQLAENIVQQGKCIPDRKDFLAFAFCEGTGHFGGEDRGGEKLMNALPVLLTQTQRFGSQGARDDRSDGNRCVDDVSHSSLSSSSLSNFWNVWSSMRPRVRKI